MVQIQYHLTLAPGCSTTGCSVESSASSSSCVSGILGNSDSSLDFSVDGDLGVNCSNSFSDPNVVFKLFFLLFQPSKSLVRVLASKIVAVTL